MQVVLVPCKISVVTTRRGTITHGGKIWLRSTAIWIANAYALSKQVPQRVSAEDQDLSRTLFAVSGFVATLRLISVSCFSMNSHIAAPRLTASTLSTSSVQSMNL